MPRDPYNPLLFAGRAQIIREIQQWATNPGDQRLLSVVGSPGIGKSWVLEHIRHDLTSRGFLVLFADAHHLAGSGSTATLRQLIRQVAQQCPSLEADLQPLLDSNLHPEQVWAGLSQVLCQARLSSKPLLIIDGLDGLSNPGDRNKVERQLIMFLQLDCTLGILARRDEWGLQHLPLRWMERPLKLVSFSQMEAQDQVQRRAGSSGPDIRARLSAQIPGYPWNHPCMNAYLIDWGMKNPGISLDSSVIQACIEDAIGSPFSPPAFQRLLDLCGQARWTMADLRSHGLSLEDPGIYELFRQGLFIEDPPFYQVADGFREMACELRRMQGSPCP